MTETTTTFDPQLAGLDSTDWLDALEDVADEHGYFEPLGRDLCAFFIDAGPKLLVTFETRASISRFSKANEPLGFAFVREDGWSHMCILTDTPTACRNPRLYRFFDGLVDESFFDRFDDVLFMGEHLGGYAAAAYSVTAPGARVLAFRPLATLESDRAGWDNRHVTARRQSFTDRYGYAPDMTEAARSVHVVFDPTDRSDAMHAALFVAPNTTLHRARFFGVDLMLRLNEGKALPEVIRTAMRGGLDHPTFGALLRPLRWSVNARVVRLLNLLRSRPQPERTLRYCDIIRAQRKVPQIERYHAEITAKSDEASAT